MAIVADIHQSVLIEAMVVEDMMASVLELIMALIQVTHRTTVLLNTRVALLQSLILDLILVHLAVAMMEQEAEVVL